MRKYNSPLANLIINYDNYFYMKIIDPRIRDIVIERINLKNIYIYYVDKKLYDFIFLFNKSNKFYRLLIRNHKNTSNFLLVNDFFDLKVREYFNFDEFEYIFRDDYIIPQYDIEIIDILKKIDI